MRALYAWMWALPGAPLLFMGAELAPYTEWSEATELEWSLLDYAPHRGVHDLLVALNRAVVGWPALYERDHEPDGFQWLDADDAAGSTYAFLRWGIDGRTAVACVANFSLNPRIGYRVGLPWQGSWQTLINTDAVEFAGAGAGHDGDVDAIDQPWQSQPSSVVLAVPPLSAVWLGSVRHL